MKVLTFIFVVFLSLANQAISADKFSPKKILISVGDLFDKKNKEWKRETCSDIYKLANQIVQTGVDITCREFDTTYFQDSALDKLSKQHDFHLRIIRDYNKNLGVDVTNWKRRHQADFTTLGWNFVEKADSKVSMKDAFTKAMSNFLFYAGNEEAFKAGLLVNGAHESNEIEFNEEKQVFIDKMSNIPISIEKAYKIFGDESPRKKNYLRTGVEIGVLLSSAMAIYYKNLVFNQVDFDYGFKDGIKKKLNGEAILFDDNDKMSNYGHVYAGVMYYQVARSNGFSSLESFLITEAASAAWEFMEYHEVFSINDTILTPIGGYVIGEATYQIACALNQKNSIAAKTLGYAVNPNMAINHGLDASFKKDRFAAQPDCKKPRWSDISVHIGLEKGQKAYTPEKNSTYNVGMNAQVINLEDYNKEGKEAKLVLDTSMTKMVVELNGNEGLVDLTVIAQIVMAAYHEKNLGRDERGQLSGYEFVIGLGSGSTWRDRGTAQKTSNEDFFGTINILGANAHANIHVNGFNIRADFAIYGDFSMVKSLAYESNKAHGADINGQSSVMQKRGYYWGYGATTLASISAAKGKWTVGWNAQMSSATSIDQRNRIESTNGDIFKDVMMINKAYVSYAISKSTSFQLSYERSIRHSYVNGSEENRKSATENRVMGTLVYRF